MQGISLWVSGLCAASLVVAVTSAIAPKNSAGRVSVMIASVLVMVALVSPVVDLREVAILDIGRDYESRIEQKIEETTEKTGQLKKDIIEEELSSYVLNKADAETSKVNIKVEDGVAVSAKVKGRNSDEVKRIRKILEDELLVPAKRQEIEIEVG